MSKVSKIIKNITIIGWGGVRVECLVRAKNKKIRPTTKITPLIYLTNRQKVNSLLAYF
jgi:hypothetical protein